MPHKLIVSENDVLGKAKYTNNIGNTECVEFVRQATTIQQPTSKWVQGKKVVDSAPGEIARGTAIATFDATGKYPTDILGKHAAIYLEHNEERILVLDQWKGQGEVMQRSIWTRNKGKPSRSNDPFTFYTIETQVAIA